MNEIEAITNFGSAVLIYITAYVASKQGLVTAITPKQITLMCGLIHVFKATVAWSGNVDVQQYNTALVVHTTAAHVMDALMFSHPTLSVLPICVAAVLAIWNPMLLLRIGTVDAYFSIVRIFSKNDFDIALGVGQFVFSTGMVFSDAYNMKYDMAAFMVLLFMPMFFSVYAEYTPFYRGVRIDEEHWQRRSAMIKRAMPMLANNDTTQKRIEGIFNPFEEEEKKEEEEEPLIQFNEKKTAVGKN